MTKPVTNLPIREDQYSDHDLATIVPDLFSPVVIAPTYNNAGTLAGVLAKLDNLEMNVIVVNDGATDDTARILTDWLSGTADAGSSSVKRHRSVVTHPVNRGKAIALQTGFRTAIEEGFTHAATIDTDGQLDPAQIPTMLKEAARHPDAMILGRREDMVDNCPSSHRLGWWMSALATRMETGLNVPDSQCGLRIYPLAAVVAAPCLSRRYGFESEFVTRAAWAGFSVREMTVSCLYFPEDEGVSHFRPWRDGVQGFMMHAYLTLRRMIPWPVRRVRVCGDGATGTTSNVLGDPLRRINPVGFWEQLRFSRFEQLVAAASFGVGVFIACMPLGGWQWLLGVYAALRLRIHMVPVVLGATIALTPWSNPLARLTSAVGDLSVGWLPIGFGAGGTGSPGSWSRLAAHPISELVGAVVVAFFLHWLTLVVCVLLFRLIPVKHDRDFSRGTAQL